LINLFLAVLLFITPQQEVRSSSHSIVKVNRNTDTICTGFIINTPGTVNTYVMTAKHCRDPITKTDTGLPTAIIQQNGHISFVNNVFSSESQDIMLLEIDKLPLNGFILSSDRMQPGGQYYTISHPINYEYIYSPIIGSSVFKESIKTEYRSVDVGYDNVIICPGCAEGTSGAPIISDGKVFGILLAKSTSIPSVLFSTSSINILRFMTALKGIIH